MPERLGTTWPFVAPVELGSKNGRNGVPRWGRHFKKEKPDGEQAGRRSWRHVDQFVHRIALGLAGLRP